MPTTFEEQWFEPEEQEEILRLAARLQAEHVERLKGSQIQIIAAEAGIGAEFVQAAAEKLQTPTVQRTRRPRMSPSSVAVMQGVFLLVQAFSLYNLMRPTLPGVGGSPFTGLAIVLALMFGVATSGLGRGPRALVRFILGASVAMALIFGAYVRLRYLQVHADWWPEVPMMVLVQCAVAVLGYRVGSLAQDNAKALGTSGSSRHTGSTLAPYDAPGHVAHRL